VAYLNEKYVRNCYTNRRSDCYKIHISHVYYLTPLYQTEENIIIHVAVIFLLNQSTESTL